jgi:hypothetical protein
MADDEGAKDGSDEIQGLRDKSAPNRVKARWAKVKMAFTMTRVAVAQKQKYEQMQREALEAIQEAGIKLDRTQSTMGMDYKLQGHRSMLSTDALMQRQALKRDPRVVAEIQKFWVSVGPGGRAGTTRPPTRSMARPPVRPPARPPARLPACLPACLAGLGSLLSAALTDWVVPASMPPCRFWVT